MPKIIGRSQRDIKTAARIEALAGYTPVGVCLIAGAVAGVLLTLSPLLLIAANAAVQFILGLIHGTGNEWGLMSSRRLFDKMARGLVPFVIASAGIGGLLGWLRRVSVQKEIYLRWVMGRAESQLGLNTCVAAFLIPVLFIYALNVAGLTIIVWVMGLGAFIIGLLYDTLWEGLDDRILSIIGRSDPGCERALEIKELLRIDEDLGQFVPRSVAVDWPARTAYVEGEYDDPRMEKRIRELVMSRVIGLQRIVVRPFGKGEAAQPAAVGAGTPIEAATGKLFRVELRPRAASR